MEAPERIRRENGEILSRLSRYLNETPAFIETGILRELTEECGISTELAFSVVLAAAIGLKIDENPHDKALFMEYFPEMVHHLDPSPYLADPYLSTVRMPEGRIGRWELRYEAYRPGEAFVFDDLLLKSNGRAIPQIGFFTESYRYPAVLENGRTWMLITPNEINTMREVIEASVGRVLTYGLGLGYYAFMAARRDAVESVTVVERDPDVIRLFTESILPLMPCRDKIRILCADAFDYAENEMGKGGFDTVFTDVWHDPSDGVPLYRRMRACERLSPQSRFFYWIERTLRYYM